MFKFAKILILGLLVTPTAFADHWREHHHHHHHGHHYYPHYRERIVYMPERVVEYVPVPRYYAPPPVTYYQYDQRSAQGLAGGMIGSMMGYQLGRGDPLASGIGAATGAWLGNGRY